MTNLDCTVLSCIYNENKSCERGNIQVGGREAMKSSETACESFVQKRSDGEKNQTQNKVGESASYPTEVACNAVKCRYNKEKKCHAEHIQIAGVHAVTTGETECGSFEPQ